MYEFPCYNERNLREFKKVNLASARRAMNTIEKCVGSKVERNGEWQKTEERVLLKAFQTKLAMKLARSRGNFSADVLTWQ